jgi:hypothetical protein
MKHFRYLREELTETKDPKSKTLHAFDMDETLFHHDHTKVKVHVNDKNGKRVQSLTNQEFNDHKLPHGHSYDFGDFRSTHVFNQSAHPIHKMINKLKAIHKSNKNVEIVTARSDMDDKKGFMSALQKHGIDSNEIHVRRAGNLSGDSPGDNKRKVISNLIKKHGYKKVHLYDDSHQNLNHFLSLKQDHPDVELHAHHVDHDPKTGNVTLTTRTLK